MSLSGERKRLVVSLYHYVSFSSLYHDTYSTANSDKASVFKENSVAACLLGRVLPGLPGLLDRPSGGGNPGAGAACREDTVVVTRVDDDAQVAGKEEVVDGNDAGEQVPARVVIDVAAHGPGVGNFRVDCRLHRLVVKVVGQVRVNARRNSALSV